MVVAAGGVPGRPVPQRDAGVVRGVRAREGARVRAGGGGEAGAVRALHRGGVRRHVVASAGGSTCGSGRRRRAPGPCRRGAAASCGSRGSPRAASSSPSGEF